MKATVLKNRGSGLIWNNLVIETFLYLKSMMMNYCECKIRIIQITGDLWIAKGLYSKIKLPCSFGIGLSGIITEAGKKCKKNFKPEMMKVILNRGLTEGKMENFPEP